MNAERRRPGLHLHRDPRARVAVQAALDDVRERTVPQRWHCDAVVWVRDRMHLLDECQR
jgi:hypothetical protein